MITVDWMQIDAPIEAGISLGYGWANQHLRSAAEANGLQHEKGADIAFHVLSPIGFVPEPSRRNVVFTMWESPNLPAKLRPYIDSADLVIVPSRFCAEIFKPYVRCPIAIVPLGVDLSLFTRKRREWTPWDRGGRVPFMWLMVGAPNFRKGWDVIEQTWQRHFYSQAPNAPMVLVQKMTADVENRQRMEDEAVKQGFAAAQGYPHVWVHGNVVLDLRMLKPEALVQTYHNAHAFVFPTGGEGWGLTLLEAMATGMPCVATRWSGLLDFTDPSCVRYVDWTPHSSESQIPGQEEIHTGMESAWVDPDELGDAMAWVMRHYGRALRMGREAAYKAKQFTWGRAGAKLVDVLTRWQEGRLDTTAAA